MALLAASIQGYSCTLQIILKSECRLMVSIFLHRFHAIVSSRILIAAIHNRRNAHCLCCLVPESRIRNSGMKLDMKQCNTCAHVDDGDRKRRVATAQHIIYKKNYAVNSEAIKNLLKEQSLGPTTVRL